MNDSIWAVVAATVKGFKFTLDYVLYDLSYANMIMLGATLPSYDSGKGKTKQEDIIDARDPKNNQRIREIFSQT